MRESDSPSSSRVASLGRLLFVDDEAPLLRGIQRIVRRRRPQWRVLTAASGAAAIALLDAGDVDVIVTDLHMPRMTGVALLQHVAERYPHIVRVVHSSQIEAVRDEVVSGLCHARLGKPATSAQLMDMQTWALGYHPLSQPNVAG
jgi:CheY-like chemotaxis protein